MGGGLDGPSRQVHPLAFARFQAAVEATVDLYRFDLMKQFHLALPVKSDAERALWATLNHLGDANSGEVDYTHG